MKTPEELEKLCELLDDEDEDVAVNVIAALLARQDELGDLPARIQEHPNPLVRRRAHQLQAAITFRNWRQEFFELLNHIAPDYLTGLVLLHMLWFDRDDRTKVTAELDRFVKSATTETSGLLSLEDARRFMCRHGFAAELESTIHPENYCIGTILSQRTGAGSLLTGLLKVMMREPEKFQIVRFCGEFALFDGKDSILACQGDWRVCRLSSTADFKFFSLRDILHCAGNMLFSSAVNSDSFRYVLTITQSLTGDKGDEILASFPYPYGERPEQGKW